VLPLKATYHALLSIDLCAARLGRRNLKEKKNISQHISRPFVNITTGWGSRFNGLTNYKQAL